MAEKHETNNNDRQTAMENGEKVKVICLGDSAVGKSKYD